MQTTSTLFWAAFGMGNSAAPNIEHEGRHHMVELVGYILYGVYILGAVVVLINMLIAMMSNTFEEIQVRITLSSVCGTWELQVRIPLNGSQTL